MRGACSRLAAAAIFAATTSSSLRAQAISEPSLTVGATSDHRVRGLSWSAGRPTLTASADVPVAGDLAIIADAAALRGSARHGGADLGFDAGAQYRFDTGPLRLIGGVTGHVFVERGGLNYVEVAARANYLVGPLTLGVGASYAPRQAAIGGDNLYLNASAEAGVPGTPIVVFCGVGRSSGTRDDVRATRLRPDVSYWDYRLGAEFIRRALAIGLRFSGTSIGRDRTRSRFDAGDAGGRLATYVRMQIR